MVTDPASAETIKYASNAFLAMKLSFVNAVAALCEAVGADAGDVMLGMGYDKRIGHDFLRPGPGLRRELLPEGHAGPAAHGRARPGYDFSLIDAAAAGQRRAVRPGRRPRPRAMVGGDLAGAPGRRCGGSPSRPTPTTGASRRRSRSSTGCSPRARGSRAFDPTVKGALPEAPEVEVVGDAYAACEGADVLLVLTEWDEFKWVDLDKVARGSWPRAASSTPATCSTRARLARRGFASVGIGR